MNFLSSVKLSLNCLRANKKRAFLTILGIIIGVGSVIVIMSVGAGAQSLLVNEISSFGSNLFGITPGAADENGPPASVMGITVTTLKLDELEDINKVPGVIAATAYVRGVDSAVFDSQKVDITYVGTTPAMLIIEDAAVAEGRFFDDNESKNLSRVVVIGDAIKQDLFGDGQAIGEILKIKKQNFRVIGVMGKRGTVAFENKDTQVFIPIKTAQKILLGINHVSLIRGKFEDNANIDMMTGEIEAVVRENHNISNAAQDDFSVRSLDQALDVLTSVTNALRFFLAGIAAISLLVGGVGIMNIMLVNITERTKEIGLRKAVGATRMNILKQFLIESLTITVFGGIIGIISGSILSWLIATIAKQIGYKWDFVITISSIFLGLGVSAAVGLIFGSYPAAKAAKMEPIEALSAE
ncbi:multidrug ABC transporter substrate-binding protein [Candidatus Kuenenbacteria bacterium CG08_land_8_20_14_0_20_37_23]|uniref:Multidrug ABC transporter substrate-binding protein n=1 Tax=Candidatus Kuenenbacteria bacterium CG08_land_8_20_14_0_20_37_23 TaxID=1974617 RepID=A0A2M6XSV5_9BACT|nr:MAG: multidrug ABC transporter substrate-binding protein [Candidatus Kuenenbacteria bacterium CG08_land_8_20_14_0_20_37_23]